MRDLSERGDASGSGAVGFGGSPGREECVVHAHAQVSLVDAVSLVRAGLEQHVVVRNAVGEFGGTVTPALRVAVNDTRVAADDGEFIAKAVVGGICVDEWQGDLLGLAAVSERGIGLD